MIDIRYIFERVQTLLNKDQTGYMDSVRFTNNAQGANTILYEYYYKIFEAQQRILDALLPFVKEVTIPVVNGSFDFPEDYRHRLEVKYKRVINNCGEPNITLIPVDYMQTNEEAYVLSDSILKPTINHPRHTFKNNKVFVYPDLQNVEFKYLRVPLEPVYSTIIVNTPNGDFEQFDPATSVDFEFPNQESENIVDLILFGYGVVIRDTPVIQFARMKQREPLIN